MNTTCGTYIAFTPPARDNAAKWPTLAINLTTVGAPTSAVCDAQGYVDGMIRLVLDFGMQIRPELIDIAPTNPRVDLGGAQYLSGRLSGRTTQAVRLLMPREIKDILDSFGRGKLAMIKRIYAGITAALAEAAVLPFADQPEATVRGDPVISLQPIAWESLQSPDLDLGQVRAQAMLLGVCLKPETRAQALAKSSDLVSASELVWAKA